MKALLIIGLLYGLSIVVAAQDAGNNSETEGVRRAVEIYLSTSDGAAKKGVVYRDARILSTDGKGRVVESRISKPAKYPVSGVIISPSQRIESIDMTEGAAVVKVKSFFPPEVTRTPFKHFQYISLLKLNGEWKIVSILMPPAQTGQVAQD